VFRLVFASLITFGLLIGMVAGVIRAAMVSSGDVNLGLAIPSPSPSISSSG